MSRLREAMIRIKFTVTFLSKTRLFLKKCHMSFKSISNLILFNCFFIAAFAQAQTRKAAIDTLISRSHRLGLFNGNVLVIDDGKEIYRAAIGYADASRQIPLTDQYRFHIGSIAKEFNAVSIMM